MLWLCPARISRSIRDDQPAPSAAAILFAGMQAVDMRAREAERIERLDDAVREKLDRGAGRHRVGIADAERIDGDDLEVLRQQPDQRRMCARGLPAGAEQDERRAGACAHEMDLPQPGGHVAARHANASSAYPCAATSSQRAR